MNCLSSSRYECSPDLEYSLAPEETGAGSVQCPNKDPKKVGNYMQYHITGTSMSIESVCMENCGEPRPKKCHCNKMLDKLLARHTFVNEIVGIFSAEKHMAGCRCYLGAAARANFNFVQVNVPVNAPGCTIFSEQRKEISAEKRSPNYYVKVCNNLFEQGCENLPGRITVA